VALCRPGRKPLIASGTCEGNMVRERRGTNGFGYDPIFSSDDLNGKTFGEAEDAEKHQVSHRSRAIKKLLEMLDD